MATGPSDVPPRHTVNCLKYMILLNVGISIRSGSLITVLNERHLHSANFGTKMSLLPQKEPEIWPILYFRCRPSWIFHKKLGLLPKFRRKKKKNYPLLDMTKGRH